MIPWRGAPALLWDLNRFGLTPRKLAARFVRRGPKVLCLSLPKAGTHLLERALCLHPHIYRQLRRTIHDHLDPATPDLESIIRRQHRGELLVGHLVHSANREEVLRVGGVRSLFIVRNPRDIVVSLAHYIVRHSNHPLHQEFNAEASIGGRIRMALDGVPARNWPPFHTRLRAYAGWLDSDALVVRFESLIGETGGGSVATQADALARIYAFLDLPTTAAQMEEIRERLFSSLSPTFRQGTMGQWRAHSHGDLEEAFQRSVGQWMKMYGYS